MAWTVLRTVTDSVSYVTAADHNETKANFDIVGGADGATKTGNWYVSGNVGIGTTSPGYKLDVVGDIRLSNNNALHWSDSGGTGRRMAVLSSSGHMYLGDVDNAISGGFLYISTNSTISLRTNNAERMIIDSSGNVGIGLTNSPLNLLDVNGNITIRDAYYLNFGNPGSGDVSIRPTGSGGSRGMSFYTYNGATSRRMDIDTNGNVGIGTTSPGYQLTLSTDSAAKPTSNTWTISSDARVKEVIGSYTRGVADIVALQPKRYRLNGAFGSVDDGRVHVSVIAQEAQATWPEMIGTYDHTDKDADDVETVTELLNLNTNELQWALVNAIKELAQRVEVLER